MEMPSCSSSDPSRTAPLSKIHLANPRLSVLEGFMENRCKTSSRTGANAQERLIESLAVEQNKTFRPAFTSLEVSNPHLLERMPHSLCRHGCRHDEENKYAFGRDRREFGLGGVCNCICPTRFQESPTRFVVCTGSRCFTGYSYFD